MKIVFLCIHNAGRSQMAAAWMERLAPEGFEVLSGGSDPAAQVNAAVVEAMAEVGIDLRGSTPRRWTDDDVASADVVVTMGCGDACPYVPGVRYEDWPVADPAGAEVAVVRPIRDEIERRVRALVAELVVTR